MPFSPQTTEIRLNNLEGQKTMTKAQHTPGPWKVEFSQISAPDEKKCIVQFGFNIRENPQAFANARLIASAPCLLQALKRWHEFAVNNGYTDEDFKTESTGWISETAAAIAKATGE